MSKQENATRDSDEKPHAAIPLPERFERTGPKDENPPEKNVGSKTPGLKKDEDMPVATERKARRDGEEPKPKR